MQDSTAVSIFAVILIELTNTETAVILVYGSMVYIRDDRPAPPRPAKIDKIRGASRGKVDCAVDSDIRI